MKDFKPTTKEFSESIPVTETTDTNHAENINAAPKQLIENDLYLKQQMEDRGLSVVEGALCVTFEE